MSCLLRVKYKKKGWEWELGILKRRAVRREKKNIGGLWISRSLTYQGLLAVSMCFSSGSDKF
ncbi:hypothetical protein HanIR_Chr12g0614591 [Helianthus annuus]|nr:hypothetical protein HanIR_Chr12g0614591 [Helianthus annuus]